MTEMTQPKSEAVSVSERAELLPCPFCKSNWVDIIRPANGAQSRVGCKSCNAQGPYTAGMADAEITTAWNTRALTASPSGDLVEAATKARDTFLHYEDLHRLKCTPEGDEKADRNREMADALTATLRATPSPLATDAADSGLVERVAKAIAAAEGAFGPLGQFANGSPMREGAWDDFLDDQHEDWRNAARAAIAALSDGEDTGNG